MPRLGGPRRAACLALGLLALWGAAAAAFEDRTPRVHALVGARVVTGPGKVLPKATVVVRDGVISAVGDVQPPADARLWDLRGRTVYAGLVEPFFDPEAGKKDSPPPRGRRGADEPARPAPTDASGVRHPNPKVRAEERMAEKLSLDTKTLEDLRRAGFVTAHLVPSQGIFRGQSAVVALRPGVPREQILRADAAQIVAFATGGWEERNRTEYPASLMGAVALVRQTFLDARWAREARKQYDAAQAGMERPQTNLAIDALEAALPPSGSMPVWMLTADVLGTLRCAALVQEFDLHAVLVGNGEEYQQLEQVRATGLPVVLPLQYPAPPAFADADEALDVELDVLRHWNAAPSNAARLHAAGIPFAFTSHDLEKRSDFRARVARAIENGLPEPAALAACTTVPARFVGMEDQLGSIERGKLASFTITDGDLFAEKTHVLEVWVNGDRYEVQEEKPTDFADLAGNWRVLAGSGEKPVKEWRLELVGNEWTLRGRLLDADGREVPLQTLRWQQGELLLQSSAGETLRLRPEKKVLRGTWKQPDGQENALEAKRPEPSQEGGF